MNGRVATATSRARKRAPLLALLLAAASAAPAQQTAGANDPPPDAVLPPPAEFFVCPQGGADRGCAALRGAACVALDNGTRCVTTPCDNTDWVSVQDACAACAMPGAIGYREGPC